VVGTDITSGLPRVEELLEARLPKRSAIVSEIDGIAEVVAGEEETVIRVVSSELYQDEYLLPPEAKLAVKEGQLVDAGTVLFHPEVSPSEDEGELPVVKSEAIVAKAAGQVVIENARLYIRRREREEKEYFAPPDLRLLVKSGDEVKAGERLTEGTVDPHTVLRVMGKEAVQHYLINEVQKVYRSQGVNIHDKHIAIIVRQMLSKVKVTSSGDTELLPEELIDRFSYEEVNAKVLAEGGEPAIADAVLLGMTRVSLHKDSWLAAASFQETDHVLRNAAIAGVVDRLRGLKENVILGRVIPAGALGARQDLVGLQLGTQASSDEEGNEE